MSTRNEEVSPVGRVDKVVREEALCGDAALAVFTSLAKFLGVGGVVTFDMAN